MIRVMALDLGTKNGFRALSFEYIGEMDSYFIHRYIIMKYRSSSITNKIHRVMALDPRMENGFRAISFEYVGVLDSYFIHRYAIIKYRSSSIKDKIHRLIFELWLFVNDNALLMRIWQ